METTQEADFDIIKIEIPLTGHFVLYHENKSEMYRSDGIDATLTRIYKRSADALTFVRSTIEVAIDEAGLAKISRKSVDIPKEVTLGYTLWTQKYAITGTLLLVGGESGIQILFAPPLECKRI